MAYRASWGSRSCWGWVVTASVVIIGVGAITVEESQSTISMENAVTKMEALNTRLLEVSTSSGAHSSVSLSPLQEANLDVEDSGWVNVTLKNRTGAVTGSANMTLGQITYTRDEQTVAIQGGGVWRTNEGSDGAAVVTEPTFEYRDLGGAPTLTMSVIDVTGVEIDGDTVNVEQASAPTRKLTEINPLQMEQSITITIKSEYYGGWGELFEERTKGDVSYPGGDRVELVLEGPPFSIGQINDAIVSPRSGMSAANSNIIDSYNSSKAAYTAPGGYNASTSVMGDFTLANSVELKGDLNVGGRLEITNNVNVYDETRVGGNARINSKVQKLGHDSAPGDDTFSVGGNLEFVKNGVPFKGDVIVGGDVGDGSTGFNGHAYENLSVQGDATLSKKAVVDGWLLVGGNGDLGPSTVSGPVFVHGDAQLGGNFENNVSVGGDVVLEKGEIIEGNLIAGGNVTLRGEVWGNVTAGGDVLLDSSKAVVRKDVTAAGSITINKGSIQGNQHASVVSVTDPASPAPLEPREPVIYSDLPSATPLIESAESRLSSNPYDGPIEDGSCTSTCTLTAGYYSMEELTVPKSGNVQLDTTSGDIEIYVDGEMTVRGHLEINGPNTVEIYANDDVTIEKTDGRIKIPGDNSSQLTLFMKPSATFAMRNGEPWFTGLLYGPGASSQSGTDIIVDNKAQVYGALIGDPQNLNNNVGLHYDTALGGSESESDGDVMLSDGEVLYVQISSTTVE